jgi:predicted DNA-binding transcriptional regulator YafY
MLLSLTIAEKVGSPVMLADLRAVTRKINAAFAPQQARRIRSLRSRVLIGEPASTAVLAGYRPPGPAVTGPVLGSFADQRMLSIAYTDAKRRRTERDVEPQCLYFNLPALYLLGWDRLRDGSASSGWTGSTERPTCRRHFCCGRRALRERGRTRRPNVVNAR